MNLICLPVVCFNLYCFINKSYSFIINVVVDVAVVVILGYAYSYRKLPKVIFHEYKPYAYGNTIYMHFYCLVFLGT